MKVLIVGGGIAGLTTALCCLKNGLSVQVFEQAPELNDVGAGLQLSPNGTRILYRLGLKESLEKVAFEPNSLDLRLGISGQKIFSIPMARAIEKYGAPYLHIHRADLISVLKQKLSSISSKIIHVGSRVETSTSLVEGAELSLSNGDKIQGDVIIGADGIHSTIQKNILDVEPPTFTGNIAWRALIPTNKVPSNLIPSSATVWTGKKRHVVTYYVRGGELINFVGVVEENRWSKESWNAEGDPNALRTIFSNFHPKIKLLTQSIDKCFKSALFDRKPLKKWHKNNEIIIGDAAHPMLPFMAQGATMAIEDAAALARMLADETSDIPISLKTFEAIRSPRTSRVQTAARSNMSLFHHGTLFSQSLNYGPIWLAARCIPQYVNSRQDWLYLHDAENPY